jgi:uncharacterized protein YceK
MSVEKRVEVYPHSAEYRRARKRQCPIRSVLIPLGLLFITSGCGTIYQHGTDDWGPYSGVTLDATVISGGDAALIVGGFFDFPLSFVADTLFLPYDLITRPTGERPNNRSTE